MVPEPDLFKAMVLLVGNYPPDQQQSMQRFSAMMLQGLTAGGVAAELIVPQPVFGNVRWLGGFVGKWLGYIDKLIFFPLKLKNRLLAAPAIVHICDHSNAVYAKACEPNKILITCHDLLAVRGSFGEQTDCPASMTGRILQKWILKGLNRADVIACVSNATARDAERLVQTSTDGPSITVVPNGLNYPYRKLIPDVARAKLAEIANMESAIPYVLHVGSNLRRKNRDGLLRIFAHCRKQWNGRLVIAGDLLNPELRSLALDLGVADYITELDNPPSETLEVLYNCATALLYPSRFEGFGWPIIEAQACGCPVVCAKTGPLPETAGDAGLFRPVEDEEGFAADVLRLTNPVEREIWARKSSQNAQRFATEKIIGQYIDIYQQLGAKL